MQGLREAQCFPDRVGCGEGGGRISSQVGIAKHSWPVGAILAALHCLGSPMIFTTGATVLATVAATSQLLCSGGLGRQRRQQQGGHLWMHDMMSYLHVERSERGALNG